MKKTAAILLAVLNVLGAIFIVWYNLRPGQSVLYNVLGLVLAGVFILDAVYAGCRKKRTGDLYLLGYVLLVVLTAAGNFVAQGAEFYTSFAYTSILATLGICAGGVAICVQDIRNSCTQEKAKYDTLFKIVRTALPVLSMLALVVFAVFAWDLVCNRGESPFEHWLITVLPYFLLLLPAPMFIVLRYCLTRGWRQALRTQPVLLAAYAVLCALVLYGFITPLAAIPGNIAEADEAYAEAFGGDSPGQAEGLRSRQVSVVDLFYNIRTAGYERQTDLCYYEGTEGWEADRLRLYYDVYYPAEGTGPYPVIIRMHGSGGEKGDFAMVNKYFAGRGYVVFDIQYGWYYESWFHEYQANGWYIEERDVEDNVACIREFVIYAKANNFCNADWGNVFVSGNSYGAMVANAFGLGYSMGHPVLDGLEIGLRGILPIYPGSQMMSEEPLFNPLRTVDENSPPLLMFMGSHDGYVDTQLPYYLKQAYTDHENKQMATVWFDYAGHGADGFFTSPYMQTYLYYMERFMAQHTV
ncbi:MAG: hypothetical protein LIO46_03090 [Clostridiales bacterium]|nr:hypothetical protein [Clostridiales bacterium]